MAVIDSRLSAMVAAPPVRSGDEEVSRLGLIEYLDLSTTVDIAAKQRTALEAARLADRLGYRRLWIPEHHSRHSPSTNALALAAVIGSQTERIRVGSAVILLRIRDPHLTAEDIATAAAFCPERLDIGIGRGDFGGPGADVLNYLRKDDGQLVRAVSRLFHVLDNGCEWIPPLRTQAERWMHGTGTQSATLAGETGLNYCHALFLNPDIDTCLNAIRLYRTSAQGTGRTAVAVTVVANDDPATASIDAQQQSFAVNCAGPAGECARMIRRLLDLTGVDDVLVGELSARPQDHFRALESILDAVGDRSSRRGRTR